MDFVDHAAKRKFDNVEHNFDQDVGMDHQGSKQSDLALNLSLGLPERGNDLACYNVQNLIGHPVLGDGNRSGNAAYTSSSSHDLKEASGIDQSNSKKAKLDLDLSLNVGLRSPGRKDDPYYLFPLPRFPKEEIDAIGQNHLQPGNPQRNGKKNALENYNPPSVKKPITVKSEGVSGSNGFNVPEHHGVVKPLPIRGYECKNVPINSSERVGSSRQAGLGSPSNLVRSEKANSLATFQVDDMNPLVWAWIPIITEKLYKAPSKN
ncbi:hypothetical protein PTTG_27255 [Puccinia triticina 1-1 BBBD Race 1]|uniref:Uncharacterized protein n=1 Tax=Puccinia triticina (isolate 1-1 / race 1 (BBBD)) TaxID=630390 RepID=A0A180GM89_PUCT1|nr:hypothetical protein PTTG_27255 [Puccinia triticina 1-1 BBBD Race 1]